MSIIRCALKLVHILSIVILFSIFHFQANLPMRRKLQMPSNSAKRLQSHFDTKRHVPINLELISSQKIISRLFYKTPLYTDDYDDTTPVHKFPDFSRRSAWIYYNYVLLFHYSYFEFVTNKTSTIDIVPRVLSV